MNQCDECNKQLNESETYKMKPKYEEGPYNTFCAECNLAEIKFYNENNIRFVMETPRLRV